MVNYLRRWKIVTAVACCMFSTLLFAVDDSQGNNIGSIELRSGVIVDLKNGRVFLMQPGNSIEAVNIADGKTLWKSTNAAKQLSEVGKFKVKVLEVDLNADSKRFWLGSLSKVDTSSNCSMSLSGNHFQL